MLKIYLKKKNENKDYQDYKKKNDNDNKKSVNLTL